MGLEAIEQTIGDTKYEVTKLPYSPGKKLLIRLLKVAGPALTEAVGALPDLQDQELGSLDVKSLVPALSAGAGKLAQALDEETFDLVVNTLAGYTFILAGDGTRKKLSAGEMEIRFSGNYGELFQWLAFALRVNFLGFSAGPGWLAEAVARAQTATVSPSRKP